ncbi:thiol:disulfide interchange protein DsbG [Paraburkholderia sp. J8-2]|uniref:thiol:disulfide interchange protein DsbG n=1 Tax=Paraburkholderia sp. J8-2 TaxID=2805440 RepID=UPI002AB6075A|nr:thiol:disulfide interchange protein DsbG [Paraburkholderia sp. J8-2]
MSFIRRTSGALFLFTLSLTILSAQGAQAVASESLVPEASVPPLPEVVTRVAGAGTHATQAFDTPTGLKGWVIEKGELPPALIYTTSDGKYAFLGNIVDAAGRNLTASYVETYIQDPMWPQFERSTFITEGATKPTQVVYAVMDPNCIYCHILWQALQPYEKEGLQVRWVPVGIIKPDSAGKAAAILQASDPAAALKAAHAGYVEQEESAGIEPVKLSPETQAELLSNLHLAQRFGMRGTPMIVFRDHRTDKLVTLSGLPKLRSLGDTLGLPQVPSDPALKSSW